jgi:alcohol dehydrogenase (NADP+)
VAPLLQKRLRQGESMKRRDFISNTAVVAAAFGAGKLFDFHLANAAQQKVANTVGNGPYATEGMAAFTADGPLKLKKFERRALGPYDVAIQLHYCGICHSDIHTVRGDWGKIQYPLIVGHEMAGEVVAIGKEVEKVKIGSRVGVGTMVNSCRNCSQCLSGQENYCLKGNTQAYGSKDQDGSITQGGYSKFVVVDEYFVFNIPDSIDLAEAGPLLCAGITVHSPLKKWQVGLGKHIAVIGLGGLGHMAVKFAKAMGAEVTVFTTSPSKVNDAKRFGAKEVLVNSDTADFFPYRYTYDFALDTIPYKHDVNRFIPLLKPDATYCRVGVGKAIDANELGQMNLVLHRNSFAGSNTGGVQETQDMIDFCGEQKIVPEIQKIPLSAIDDSWKKVIAKKARYRYVIDMRA